MNGDRASRSFDIIGVYRYCLLISDGLEACDYDLLVPDLDFTPDARNTSLVVNISNSVGMIALVDDSISYRACEGLRAGLRPPKQVPIAVA